MVDDSKYLTSEMQFYYSTLNQSMQGALSDDGWTFPQVTGAQLTDLAPDMPDGTGWYETDAHVVVFKINGALQKVTTTAYP